MVKVELWYDETIKKWDPYVTGAQSSFEAKRAFQSAVETMQMLDPALLPLTMTRPLAGGYHMIPAAASGSVVSRESGTFLEKPNG